MKSLYITGWTLNIVGIALWLYGYLSEGTASLLDWSSFAPEWISAYIPNLETEIGILLMCLAAIPFFRIAMLQNADQPDA